MDKKITVGNVCFVFDKAEKKILLLKRNREPMKGMCTGVGGKTDFHEDIRMSCFREVKEETGLDVINVRLKGVLKTILDGKDSSWILFIYTAEKNQSSINSCDEGELSWVAEEDLHKQPLVGFIREVLPHILNPSGFFEGTVRHDMKGVVLESGIVPVSFFGL